jgi:AcrR family transcriptional regulator
VTVRQCDYGLMRMHDGGTKRATNAARVSNAGDAGNGTTPDRLIRAAEALFASHGIDAVSLREINRLAGARNATALQYHFHDRDGLLRAVLAKHGRDVEIRRHALLDAYEAEGRHDPRANPGGSPRAKPGASRQADLRALAGALVRPLAAKLADPDGGPQYLQIHAELMNRPRPVFDPVDVDNPSSSIGRWRALVAGLLDEDATRLHRRFVAIRFSAFEVARRARSGPHTDDRLFTSDLVDLVTGVLSAPLSDETRRLDAERTHHSVPQKG